MINFGVLELANSKATSAPGWAYVPDLAPQSTTALQPRKRARNAPSGASAGETTAKQDAKILRELALLDRDNHRDVSIPVPIRHRDGGGRVSHGKVTPSVKKILQSQKTFMNHLSDFEAQLALAPPGTSTSSFTIPPPPTTPSVRAAPASGIPHLTSTGKRSHKKKVPNAFVTPTPLRKSTSAAQLATTPQPIKTEVSEDTSMANTNSHTPSLVLDEICHIPIPHPGDNDELLVSRIPPMPSAEEIEKLLSQPPLTYAEARGPWVDEDRRKPVRAFCEVCGYWGRVRCKRCGGRVCALECMSVHQEECYGRYGA